MAYIYLDESGDLGFDFSKEKVSRYFIVTCLFVANRGPVEKIISKIYRGFSRAEQRSHGGVLHAFKEKPVTRQRLLNLLATQEVSVLSIYLNKSKVYTHLHDEKHVLYNYVTNILIDRICTKKLVPTDGPIVLIAAQRETNRFLNENFRNYLALQVAGNHKLKMDIEIKTPHQDKCLQVVDCVSWALFRRREHGDESYYNLIKRRVVEESSLFA